MQTHGGLAAPKAVYTGCHENYKRREMQNIYYLLEILQNGGGIQGLWCRPDTLELTNSGRSCFDARCKRCDDPFLWTDTDVFHWCTGGALSGMYDHLGCPQTAAEFLSLRAIMLCSTTVMVSRRVEFTIIRLCVSHIGMLMQSFPSPDIEFRFSQPSIRALGDVEVPISVGNNLEITPVSPFAKMSTNIHKSVSVASPTRISISFN